MPAAIAGVTRRVWWIRQAPRNPRVMQGSLCDLERFCIVEIKAPLAAKLYNSFVFLLGHARRVFDFNFSHFHGFHSMLEQYKAAPVLLKRSSPLTTKSARFCVIGPISLVQPMPEPLE